MRSPRGRTPCVVENISAGGMFVRTDKLEDVGSQLFVDLVRPGWKRQLTLMARVTSRVDSLAGHISHKPPGMGLQFQRLEPEHFERLKKLLGELGAPEEGEAPEGPPTELELKPITLEDEEPLDPQPQPLWKQLEMIEEELDAAPLDPVEFEPRSRPPPVAPIVLTPEPRPPPPPPPARPVPAPPPAAPPPDEVHARLMMQIRGLVLQLADAQQIIAQRDLEIERLREALESAGAKDPAASKT